MFRNLDVELKMLLRTAAALAAAVSLFAVAPAEAQTKRVFGVGEPATIGELPEGAFRSALEALPPQAQGRALGLLQQGTVPIEDFAYLRVNRRGDLLFVDPDFDGDLAVGEAETPVPPSEITEANAFMLHSKPGAANILYLDFDGHDVQNSIWNSGSGKAMHPMRPYSRDADYYSFSQIEIDIIADSWRQVAEDFAPFDIDVTTQEPAAFGSNVGHVLVTQKEDADGDLIYSCSCGGVAYLNVWGNPYGFPGLVFNTSLRGVAEAASHEFGHNLSLYHDGVSGGAAYYSVSDTGHLVYISGGLESAQRSLVWVGQDGREERIAVPPRAYHDAQLSPDGTKVALQIDSPYPDIWALTLATLTTQRVTYDLASEHSGACIREALAPVFLWVLKRRVFRALAGFAQGAHHLGIRF